MEARIPMILSLLIMIASAICEVHANEGYCGLYSLHAALNALGVRADFERMIDPSYLSGTYGGSTASDLVRLAENYGIAAVYRTRMTVADLYASQWPVILHTSTPVSPEFHHWVLFLGMDSNNLLRIYDPPRDIYTLSSAELLSQWDGKGIVVGEVAYHRRALSGFWLNLETMSAVLMIIIVGLVITCFNVIVRYAACSIAIVAVVSALCWHSIIDYGFFRNRYAIAIIASQYEEYEEVPFPNLTLAEVQEIINYPKVTIIDARQPQAYARSHLPGALNIPITVTHGALRDSLAAIPIDNQIIVYCESDLCNWADAIARQFSVRGYRHVFIFRGGMAAWQAGNAGNTVVSKVPTRRGNR